MSYSVTYVYYVVGYSFKEYEFNCINYLTDNYILKKIIKKIESCTLLRFLCIFVLETITN